MRMCGLYDTQIYKICKSITTPLEPVTCLDVTFRVKYFSYIDIIFNKEKL